MYQVRGVKSPYNVIAAKMVKDATMAADEADGLRFLKQQGALVPDVIYPVAGKSAAYPVLMMEYIDRSGDSHTLRRFTKTSSASKKHTLLESLLALYSEPKQSDSGGRKKFGYHRHNWIGNLRQENKEYDKFSDFWWQQRILPQLNLAIQSGLLDKKDKQQMQSVVLPRLEDWRPGANGARPVHGDLWSGNVLRTASADFLIDPSVAWSVPDQDLAMLDLFGSPVSLRDITAELESAGAVTASPAEVLGRLDFFQLYPLLVHVNIFGRSYVPEVRGVVKRYL